MNYGDIREFDVANGPGIRVTLFVTGCTHNCKGCFNKEYQNFNAGKLFTENELSKILSFLDNKSISGFTILGGEPMQNVDGLLNPVKKIREFIDNKNKQENKKLDIWIYSGYTFEEINKNEKMLNLLKLCDVLVDGKFVEELLNLSIDFRGSENQRIINIQKSLKENKVILMEGFK